MPSSVEPHLIPSFTVVRLDWDFGKGPESKLFVTIGHYPIDHIYCLKATSQLERYKGNRELEIGSVAYPALTVKCFPKDTRIEPDNGFEVPYNYIRQQRYGTFEILEKLPNDFKQRLKRATDNSIIIDGDHRDALDLALKAKI